MTIPHYALSLVYNTRIVPLCGELPRGIPVRIDLTIDLTRIDYSTQHVAQAIYVYCELSFRVFKLAHHKLAHILTL